MKPQTIAVHVGSEPDEKTGAVIPPIYQTSTFARPKEGEQIYEYTRAGNPNFTRFEETMAALEGGKFATVFSSGLGAITAVLTLLKGGDSVVTSMDLYGGTTRLITKVFSNFNVTANFVKATDDEAWKNAMSDKSVKLCFIESPTNPLLQIANISKICDEAKKRCIISVVDNTFATPIFQRPLSMGADIVLHSTTKYIGGHSDVIGGVTVTNDRELKEKLDFARKAMGLNPSPFDVWLSARGIKTLPVRMEQHQKNAMAVAKWLSSHPNVIQVIYPGLESHPKYTLAGTQMSGFGGMIAVRFKKDPSKLKLFTRAESLGGVESLISHPASQTHASLSAEERRERGITDDLWRLSVGIEDPTDLIEDLKSAI